MGTMMESHLIVFLLNVITDCSEIEREGNIDPLLHRAEGSLLGLATAAVALFFLPLDLTLGGGA